MESLKKKMAQKSFLVPYRPFNAMNKNSGFSLIEVLIAMIVLAVGLLGLAGLQATSLRNNQRAYNRSVATQLAYEIADRMRANYTESKSGNAYAFDSATDKPVQKPNCSPTPPNPVPGPGCLPADMAQNDLYEWYQAVQNLLPGSSGQITTNSGFVTVTISWAENRYVNGTNVSGTTSFLMNFQL